MIVRIAYYSWMGHTQKVAEALAGMLNKNGVKTELAPIKPEKKFNVAMGAMKAMFMMKAPIVPGNTSLAGIDALVIATPVWAGKVPPFVNEYIATLSGQEGKPFYVIAEMGGRGGERAIGVVRTQLEKNGMKFVASAMTIEKEVDSGAFTDAIGNLAESIRKA